MLLCCVVDIAFSVYTESYFKTAPIFKYWYLISMSIASLTSFLKRALRRLGLMPLVTNLNNLYCLLIKKYCFLTGKNHLEHIYNDNFFNLPYNEQILGNTPKILAETVSNFYRPKSIVDFGCGCGLYLKEFEDLGSDILGIDGSPAASRNLIIYTGRFLLQDLTQRFDLSKRYDCAICFEVAEHIPTEASEILVDNITRASNLVIFSAAHKGQGGHNHINEQDPEFWVNLFIKRDFKFLEDHTQKIRKILTDQNAIFWLKENILIFRR